MEFTSKENIMKKYENGGSVSSSGARRLGQSKANAKAGPGLGRAALQGGNRNAAATPGGGGGGYAGQGKAAANASEMGMSKGRGKPMTYKSGGRVTRGDGIAQRGHTRGKIC